MKQVPTSKTPTSQQMGQSTSKSILSSFRNGPVKCIGGGANSHSSNGLLGSSHMQGTAQARGGKASPVQN